MNPPDASSPVDPEEQHAAHAWLRAAHGPAATRLESIYADAANAIDSRGPACWASGRCCNFEKTGHRLYVTGFEAAYCLARLPHAAPARTLSLPQIHDARQRGDCPFLDHGLCGVHTIKPLGCRVYFCDRSAQHWQHELSERLLLEIRTLHDQHALPYRYGEWRGLLELLTRTPSHPADPFHPS